MCVYMYIVFTVSQFHAAFLLSLFSLSNCINSTRKHDYEFITTVTIEFGESIQS